MTKISSNLRIAIDLTPLRSGGENGGVKVLISTFLEDFPKFAPNFQFILLAAPWNYQELIKYESCQQIKCLLMPDLLADEPAIEPEPEASETNTTLPEKKINLKQII